MTLDQIIEAIGVTPYHREPAGVIYARSEETKRKMSEAAKRAWQTKRQKAVEGEERVIEGRIWIKIRSAKGWLYWRLKDGEHHIIADQSGTSNPFYGKQHSRDTIEKLRQFAKGRKASDETKRKMSVAGRGRKKTPEWKKKIGESHRKYPYDKWSQDRAIKSRVRRSAEYRDWRQSVFERDNYTCQQCGGRNGNGKEVYLEAHHIKSYTHYPALRFETSNGVTLCKHCHQIENKKQMIGNKNGIKRNQTAS